MPKAMIGCDLGKRYCQISYYNGETEEPHTAENIMYPSEGLYERAVKQEQDAVRELGKIVITALKAYQEIDSLVFTVPELNIDVDRMLKGMGRRAGAPKGNIYVQDYKESFCNYMLNQPKELWQYEAALFDCDRYEVKAYMLRKIRSGFGRGRETFVTVDEVSCARMEELSAVYPVLNVDRAREADAGFKQFVQGVFEKKLVSSVFLVGEGFANNWYPQSLRVMCNGRRAFLGNNLYSKGACYAAMKRASGFEDTLVYLDESMMMDQISLKIRKDGREGWQPIVPWGVRWYEADTELELLLDTPEDMEIHIESLTGTETRVEKISLAGLPARNNYTLRLQVKVIMQGEKACRICLKDVGFGDFFAPTDFYLEHEIQLGGSHEQFYSLS